MIDDLQTRPQGTPLFERDAEIAAIRDALDRAADGAGRLVLIEGGAGIGKSRLLGAAGQLAEAGSFQRLHARSGEPERDFPFGVARQLYEPPLARAQPADRAQFLGGAAELAAPLFDDARWGRTLASDDDSLFPLLHGLFWLTHNLAAETPLLMQVDDLHWADASSLRLLHYLARRLDDLPVAIIATTRPNESHAKDVLEEMRTLPSTLTLALQPLTESAVTRIVRGAAFPEAEDSFCRACAEATGGNPFLLVELIGALAAEGVPPTAEGAAAIDVTSPEAVSRHVLIRLRKLPAPTLALARAAAVAGDRSPLRHAAALAGLAPDEAGSAADALVAAEILQPGDPLCFVHPVVRSAVYADLPTGERSRTHVRLARLVAAEGAPATLAAAHLLRGQRGGERWVVDTLVQAAEQALAGGAPDSAVDYLRRALEEPPEPGARPDLLVALAEAEAASGDPQAFGRFEEALEAVDDDRRAAQILFLLGRRLYMFGKFPEAARAFDRGSRRLGDRDPDLGTQLEAGYVSVARLDVSLRPAAAERFETLMARPEGRSSDMESVLLGHVAFERAIRGESREEIVALARRALAGGHLLGGGTEEGLDAVVALAYSDELEDAQRALDRSIDAARRRGSIVAYARTLNYRAWVAFRQGRLVEAMADVEAVMEHAEEVPVAGPAVEALLALVLVEQGQPAEAERVLQIENVEERWGWSAPYVYFLEARARVAMASGRPEDALTDLRAAGELLGVLRATNPSLVPWRSEAALACHRLGRSPEAEQLASEELELARDFGAPRALGLALRSQGIVTGGDDGLALLHEAVDVLAEGPDRLEHARALTELGAALRRANRRADARGPLSEGFELAERCAAWALRDRVLDELSAAGARVVGPVSAGAEPLTPSERRVAGMAAGGMSNKDIAQALFVTVKAIEWHLSNAYRKLGIKSRRQLGDVLDGDRGDEAG